MAHPNHLGLVRPAVGDWLAARFLKVRMTRLVTCVLATRGKRIFARQAVAYMARQDYRPLEFLVCDNGQEGETLAYNDIAPLQPHVTYLHVPRATLGALRNFGASVGKGKIIAQFDNDDWYAPHRVTRQVERMHETRAPICSTQNGYMYNLRDKTAGKIRPFWFSGGTVAVTREALLQSPWQDITIGEDGNFFGDAEKNGIAICDWDALDLYVYMRHASNISAVDFYDHDFRNKQIAKSPQDMGLAVRAILGADVGFYDDISDLMPVRNERAENIRAMPFNQDFLAHATNAYRKRRL